MATGQPFKGPPFICILWEFQNSISICCTRKGKVESFPQKTSITTTSTMPLIRKPELLVSSKPSQTRSQILQTTIFVSFYPFDHTLGKNHMTLGRAHTHTHTHTNWNPYFVQCTLILLHLSCVSNLLYFIPFYFCNADFSSQNLSLESPMVVACSSKTLT